MKKLFTLIMTSSILMVSLNANAQCAAPANLAFSYNNNISTFTWDAVPGATEYYFEIDWAGAGWSFGINTVTDNRYELAGLMQGGNFQWRVTANCGTVSAPSATAFFSTPCLVPYNLSATNITNNSATLNWMQSNTINNNNTGFSISYRLANTNNAWIQLTNVYNNPTATFFNLTGLAAGTTYEWRVKRACSYFNSDYINSTFTTLSCISNGNNSNEWIDLFSLGTINRTSLAEPGGYANVQTSTDLSIGSNNNAGQISAGFYSTLRNQRFSVYIDFNRNGSFNDAGERLINSVNINNAGIKNFSLNIPATATAGPTRMRVIMRRSSGSITPCITGYYGETEDYNVNLLSNSNRVMNYKEVKPFVLTPIKEEASGLSVSPNPSNGKYSIKLQKIYEDATYEIININGASVLRNKISKKDNIQIDISNQPKGLYILRIIDKGGKQQTQKLQKL